MTVPIAAVVGHGWAPEAALRLAAASQHVNGAGPDRQASSAHCCAGMGQGRETGLQVARSLVHVENWGLTSCPDVGVGHEKWTPAHV